MQTFLDMLDIQQERPDIQQLYQSCKKDLDQIKELLKKLER